MIHGIRFLTVPLYTTVGLSLFLSGCDTGNEVTTPEGSSTVTLSVDGLEPIGGGLNYQAWLVHGSGGNTFGFPLVVFNMNGNGQMVDPVADTVLTGPYHADVDAADAQGLAISLELSDVLLEVSSFSFVLSGEFIQGTADMSADDFFALNRDFSNAAGKFTLATPTDDVPDNELHGLWFMDPTTNPTEAGLDLPQVPNGWIYEGWADVGGHAISTGRFVSGLEADSTDFYSSGVSNDRPVFPGEDFLFNAPQGFDFPLDLSEASVFVTIEPWHDYDVYPEEPFFLRILEGQVPANPATLTLYQMTSLASQLPTGTATIQSP